MNLAALNVYARDLTGVYSTDVVSDVLLNRWINESYKELARLQAWPWLPVTDLVNNTDVPAFDADYHHILAYRAASRVLRFQADDTPRGAAYDEEYQMLLQDMLKAYLPGLAPALSGNRAQLRRLVRDLCGIYDDSISDAMLNLFINDSYGELAWLKDWDWLESTYATAVPTYTSGAHTITLPNGTRRVIEAFLIGADGSARAMKQVPSLSDVTTWDNEIKYDVTASGVFSFAPEFETTNSVSVRYSANFVTLDTDTDAPLFDPAFHKILAYRAASKVLTLVNPQDARLGAYVAEYQSLLESMNVVYELDHDTTPIQLGGEGLNFRSYIPWFKPA